MVKRANAGKKRTARRAHNQLSQITKKVCRLPPFTKRIESLKDLFGDNKEK